jgi:UDPglucose--hexose-1-phosphate uridylyltransferase
MELDTRLAVGCPFCPGSAEVPSSYSVLILPSRYPAVQSSSSAYADQAYGRHSVFLYTSAHTGSLAAQTDETITKLLADIGRRTDAMLADPLIQSVFSFESYGDHFGPTVAHPHGQIIGFSFTPRRIVLPAPSCLVCQALNVTELRICGNREAVVATPGYARLPFEMIIVPRRHVASLSRMTGDELLSMARLVKLSLRLCVHEDGSLPPYLLTIMEAPKGHQAGHHLRIELIPLHSPAGGLKRLGGVELGAGVYLNPVRPERAAELLRGKLP